MIGDFCGFKKGAREKNKHIMIDRVNLVGFEFLVMLVCFPARFATKNANQGCSFIYIYFYCLGHLSRVSISCHFNKHTIATVIKFI